MILYKRFDFGQDLVEFLNENKIDKSKIVQIVPFHNSIQLYYEKDEIDEDIKHFS